MLAPLQIFVGDLHGLNTLEHQPAKIAAMEAIWNTERGAPLVLFAVPNEDTQAQRLRDRDAQGREPHPAGTIRDGELKGLDAFAPDTPAGGAAVLRLPRHGGHGRG